MKFSVLMSVYFKEKPEYLSEAIQSILNQKLPPDEIVIVKDGALNYELDKVIEDFSNKNSIFKIIALEKNVGLGEALRIGVLNCTYDIIARMDSDDICSYERFWTQSEVFRKDPLVDVVGGWIAEFEDNIDNITSIRKVPLEEEAIKIKARYRNPLNHMAVMFKKASVLGCGNYKPFLWNEDYYLWVRMIMGGCKIINLPEILVYARAGRDMIKRRGGLKYIKNEIKLQKEFKKIKFINSYQYVFNIVLRTSVRILPGNIRRSVYTTLLRR